MPKYKTLVNGMTGTGEPNIEEYAVPTASDEQPTHGNTFSGMIVDEDIKNQIESGSASDFLKCRRREDGKYDLIPTLPKEGCNPGKPKIIFKIRENHNRLMKGIARKFIDSQGNFSHEAGHRFAEELNSRFCLPYQNIDKAKDINTANPYSLEKRRYEQSFEWLCNEMEIPDKGKDDFKNYLEASGIVNRLLFSGIFMYYADKFGKALNIREHLNDGSLLVNKPGKPALNAGDLITTDELTKSYEELDKTKKKLMDMAEIDPVTDDVAFLTDCEFNESLTNRYKLMSDTLNNRPKQNDKDERFHVTFPELGSNDPVKWDIHYAPIIGSVTKDGQTYLLTLETIAPAPNCFAKDPPMTRPAIGLYKNAEYK